VYVMEPCVQDEDEDDVGKPPLCSRVALLRAGIACYERALALMPRHADALYNLGVACAEDGQTERALFCYELTTHFNPNCAEAWNNLGVLHKEADNLERAAECYMAALNIRPNFPQVGPRRV